MDENSDFTRKGGVIDRDINRTYPNHEDYVTVNGLGQETLRNVLYAFADYDKEVYDTFFCLPIGQVHTRNELHCRSVFELYDRGGYILGSSSTYGEYSLSNEQMV